MNSVKGDRMLQWILQSPIITSPALGRRRGSGAEGRVLKLTSSSTAMVLKLGLDTPEGKWRTFKRFIGKRILKEAISRTSASTEKNQCSWKFICMGVMYPLSSSLSQLPFSHFEKKCGLLTHLEFQYVISPAYKTSRLPHRDNFINRCWKSKLL